MIRIFLPLDKISKRIEKKFGRKNNLSGAIEEVKSNYNELETNFKVFFPGLILYVENLRNDQQELYNFN